MSWSADATAGAAIGVFAVLTLLGAVGYRSSRAARRLQVAMATPNIVVALRSNSSSGTGLELVVENGGLTAASRVRIRVEPSLVSIVDRSGGRIVDWFVFKEGLTTLLAGQRYAICLDEVESAARSRYRDTPLHKVSIDFDWTGDHVRHVTYDLALDLSELSLIHENKDVDESTYEHTMRQIARRLKSIERQMKAPSSAKTIRSIVRQLEPRLRTMEKSIRKVAKEMNRGRSERGSPKQPSEKSQQLANEPVRVPLKMHTVDWDAADLPS